MTLSSSLSKDQCQKKWEGLLGQNYDTVGGDPTHPNSGIECSSTASGSEVRMTLASDDEYTLRISKIGFGDTSALSDAVDAKEVVPTETEKVTAPGTVTLDATVGKEKSFTVLVRDKYGNPVSGAEVNIDQPNTDPDRSRISPSESPQPKTNDQGKVTFTYTPTSTGSKEITVSSPKADPNLKATYEFDITDDDNSDNNPDDIGGDIDNGYGLDQSHRVLIQSATVDGNSVDFTFKNIGDVDMTATRAQFNGYVGKFQNSRFATEGEFAGTHFDINGKAESLNDRFDILATDEDAPTDEDETTESLTGLDIGNDNSGGGSDNSGGGSDSSGGGNTKTGLLIVSVEYEYDEDGETETATATYAVTVNDGSGS